MALHKAFGIGCAPQSNIWAWTAPNHPERAPCTALPSKQRRWEPGGGQHLLSWLTWSKEPLPPPFPTGGWTTGPFHSCPWRLTGGIWQPWPQPPVPAQDCERTFMLPPRAQGAGEAAPLTTPGKAQAPAMVSAGHKTSQWGSAMRFTYEAGTSAFLMLWPFEGHMVTVSHGLRCSRWLYQCPCTITFNAWGQDPVSEAQKLMWTCLWYSMNFKTFCLLRGCLQVLLAACDVEESVILEKVNMVLLWLKNSYWLDIPA